MVAGDACSPSRSALSRRGVSVGDLSCLAQPFVQWQRRLWNFLVLVGPMATIGSLMKSLFTVHRAKKPGNSNNSNTVVVVVGCGRVSLATTYFHIVCQLDHLYCEILFAGAAREEEWTADRDNGQTGGPRKTSMSWASLSPRKSWMYWASG